MSCGNAALSQQYVSQYACSNMMPHPVVPHTVPLDMVDLQTTNRNLQYNYRPAPPEPAAMHIQTPLLSPAFPVSSFPGPQVAQHPAG